MQINVSQLLKESIGATREYRVDEPADIIGDGNKYNVAGDCRLLRTDRSILATCSLKTEVALICCRCLCRFRYPLEIRFEEEFLPTLDILSGTPLPPPEESHAFTIDEHHTLDLSEAVRQYALMSVPMKELCDEDCAGICQSCGKNLNQGKCDCPAPEIDHRWSALTKLQ
ncbi:MAG: hypothetical protein A2Z29_11445 [Chloroflexi bacterium RBG_16_56_11]|nr:MAG: hypothetical protein A2Z29_11445 [Chloroflexi bacterium RBG_16_56_11]